jgi:hypothetical protein
MDTPIPVYHKPFHYYYYTGGLVQMATMLWHMVMVRLNVLYETLCARKKTTLKVKT